MRAMRSGRSVSAEKLARLLASLAALSVVVGCATSGSKSTGAKPDVGGDYTEDTEIDEVASPAAKAAIVDLPKTSKLDRKYQALGQAVRAGRATATVEEAGKILSASPNDPIALNTLALYHMRAKRIGAAKLLMNRAFEKNEPTPALHNNMAVILLEDGDQGGAVANLKKALRLDDDHPEALGNLGSLYAQGGDYARALPLLERSYKQNRANAAIANNYAVALRATKNLDGAKRIYEDLIKQNSRDVAALLNYSILLIEYMNKPKDGLALLYKVKFLETERKDVLMRANALEKKAKSELK